MPPPAQNRFLGGTRSVMWFFCIYGLPGVGEIQDLTSQEEGEIVSRSKDGFEHPASFKRAESKKPWR